MEDILNSAGVAVWNCGYLYTLPSSGVTCAARL